MAIESLASGGCIVSGAVRKSGLFSNVRMPLRADVSWSVLLPVVQFGRRARITRCVGDRGVIISDDLVTGEDAEMDAKCILCLENGIVLVTRGMLDKLRSLAGAAGAARSSVARRHG